MAYMVLRTFLFREDTGTRENLLSILVGAGAGICLELEPETEISKMGGSGNPGKSID